MSCKKPRVEYPRYPFGPLYEAAGRPSIHDLALRLGVERRQIYRWKKYGLDDPASDRAAVRLGVMPWHIWPDWREAGWAAVEDWDRIMGEMEAS